MDRNYSWDGMIILSYYMRWLEDLGLDETYEYSRDIFRRMIRNFDRTTCETFLDGKVLRSDILVVRDLR